MSKLYKFSIKTTSSQQIIHINKYVEQALSESGIKEGIGIIFCPHTTGGITINENADPDVVHDLLYGFEKVYPEKDRNYRHFEGNSHSHLKSSTVGASQTVIITEGKLLLGTWQDIYFCEFDGPRTRNFYVKIIEG
ncbi:hypothetical protein CPJCM30710_12530 [Clostridium polyendosporum]|uniref:Secondary thiamine-phosphate synthase enzyme n=1 Tax=Clostridium polyendosporum TaxID=69208 RepID=A0A919RY26_9CLOT|nr:secondary thiamine-phosphate synthase enzyme YjbQ [Clostridium polyendosporum]GIM28587.1 hypothetical protein CPJCM30710_12530 [Clostridium polyendosporum]